MTVRLPDDMLDDLEQKARAAGLSSVSAYLIYLVITAEAERFEREGEDADGEVFDHLPGPPELVICGPDDLAAKLDVGSNSGPPVLVTPEFWAERRRVLAERIAARADRP